MFTLALLRPMKTWKVGWREREGGQRQIHEGIALSSAASQTRPL